MAATPANQSSNAIRFTEINATITINGPYISNPPVPMLELLPTDSNPLVNSLFDVNVWLMGSDHNGLEPWWDVAGFDFKVAYNSTLMTGLDVTINPTGWFGSFWPEGVLIEENGMYPSGYSWIEFHGLPGANGTHVPVTGSGIIAALRFKTGSQSVNSTQLNIVNATVIGFPHPERPYDPWDGSNSSVALPFSTVNATVTILAGYEIAVTSVVSSKTIVGQGYSMNISVSVADLGSYLETFNVTAYANATTIATKVVTLASGNSSTITFTWNTKGFPYGNYTISANTTLAYATPFLKAPAQIEVTIPGDVDGNRVVNILDVIKITSIYGMKQGNTKFNPNCDIDNDGKITILDVVTCTSHYGQKWS
jgi:hypothetical protein